MHTYDRRMAIENFSRKLGKSLLFLRGEGQKGEGLYFLDKKDLPMRRWLALTVALGTVFLFVGSALAAGMEIEGVIVDWKAVKARVPAKAYLQLVKYGDQMKGNTDEEGYSAFDSKLPKIKVNDNGAFKLKAKEIPPGKYFIALQRALPKEMAGETIASAIPILITEKEQALVIQVPGDFPMNVGKVFVAVRAKKEPPKKEEPKAEESQKEAPKPESPKEQPAPPKE